MQLKEVLDRQGVIKAELKRMEVDPDADSERDGDLVDTLLAEYDALEARRVPLMERAVKLNLISTNATVEGSTEDGDSVPQSANPYRPAGFTQTYRNKRDPFDNMQAVRTRTLPGAEMESRALDAIEFIARAQWCDFPDDAAEAATRTVHQSYKSKEAARHILLTGSMEYYEGFRAYLADPMGNSMAERATTTGTASLGYMLPFVLDPTIILSNSGSVNPYRQVSRVEQTAGPTWNGVSSAGVNAAFGSEGGAATDQSPTVGQIQITPQRALAWVFGSYESLEDSDLGAQLPSLFGDAKDRLEESAFATGAGTGVLPQGVVTGGTTGQTAAATAYAVGDVYATQQNLPARWRRGSAAWLSSLNYINKTRQFDTAGGSSFWANLGEDTPERLLGKPIYESTSMSTATASGSAVLVFGDMSQFIIVDRIGMSIIYNPMVTAAATANLPTGEAGWYAFWRVSSKVAVSTAIRFLKIQ